jgi:hypothetical protein
VNLPQKGKDAKILHQVQTQLNKWAGKSLSLAARVLVTNQVILASIWYLCPCCNVSKGVLLRIRALVRNFIWGGNPDHKVKARVAWDTAIIPTIKGGLKIFDPYAQARALLAKMLNRALVPGAEPWKTFIKHRVANLKLRRDGDWGISENWLLTTPRTVPQGSTLWRAIWVAWTAVRRGLRKQIPLTLGEKLRQPLYLNPLIATTTGHPLGTQRRSSFRYISIKGINAVKDIWSSQENRLITTTELRRKTRAHNTITMHGELSRACNKAFSLA